MKYYQTVILAVALLFGAGCNRHLQQFGAGKKAQNVILLIGDGMGLTQMSTAYYYENGTPSFSRFPIIGLHQNKPTDELITDSAAGATAFSTGYKSYNAAIGVDDDTISRETILEMAAKKGLSTGLIATSAITHATPAAFFAHVPFRDQQDEIATQLPSSPVDFFAGGGLQFFHHRKDGRDVLGELKEAGFTVDTTSLNSSELLSISKKYGYLLAPDGLPKMQEGRGDFLPQATQMALDYLSQDKDGFFLMVEGSQIDWGGHNNDADYVIEEVKDFDKAIGVALDFAAKKGNTLVIVTADHETGGMSLSAAEVRMQRDYNHIKPTFSTGGHSATLIPVYAYGPGAWAFAGIYQNNDIFEKMVQGFGWK
ncbi:MAG: alkaline phosphatase [Lewinellaceae bacterium]|nr:alkaline phosphatase [Lewinellaceae bacterium]